MRLLVLVADKDAEVTIRTLLSERWQSLGLPKKLVENIDFKIVKHPNKDSGVYSAGANLLRLEASSFTHTLVILDREWDGAPPVDEIVRQLGTKLSADWEDNHFVVVPDPEIDMWLWIKNNPHISDVLGMTWDQILDLAYSHGLWERGANKPSRPKELLDLIVSKSKGQKHHTSGTFSQVAERVTLNACTDESFVGMKNWLNNILQERKE